MLLDFPIVEAIRSMLPLVDELIVNVGTSEDDTLRRVAVFRSSPKVKIYERSWAPNLGGRALARETQFGFKQAGGDWIIYIQADEIADPNCHGELYRAMIHHLADKSVDGLSVKFVHHYAYPDLVATGRNWYRREVRVVRNGRGVESYDEAQGFRRANQRIRAVGTGAIYHHYGWSRPVAALREKSRLDFNLYGRKPPRSEMSVLPWQYGLRPFTGKHPEVMREWIANRTGTFPEVGPVRWDVRQMRNACSALIERTTGRRIWEYRNYVEV